MISAYGARSVFLGILVATGVTFTPIAMAQPGPGMGRSGASGYMMGPGMMDRQQLGRMCSPRLAGFGEWRIDRVERELKLNEAQRAKLADLRSASSKAADVIRAACPTDAPTTLPSRAQLMEKRMEAMLQGIKAVRPALEAFYESLNDEQKSVLNSGGPRRFWRWRDRW